VGGVQLLAGESTARRAGIEHRRQSGRGAARRWWYEHEWITSPEGGSPRKRNAQYRHATVEEKQEMAALAQGQTVSEWVKDIGRTPFIGPPGVRVGGLGWVAGWCRVLPRCLAE
jgi:hypothetical protein